jgi:superoxide dismutase, Cu-Zn family
MKPFGRPLFVVALSLVSGVACGDPAGADGGAGASSNAGTGPVAGSAPVATGGTSASSGGTSASGGYVPVPLAGSGQAVGGGDQGTFFPTEGQVPIMPPDMPAAGSGGGGSGIPGDGNVFTSKLGGGNMSGTAKFTQRGEDVELELNMTQCPDGKHRITIHDAFSCDGGQKGDVWKPRGDGIGPSEGFTCSGGKGTLKYTRSGADKNNNWTVGDHVVATDLTSRIVIVSSTADFNSVDCCGNFF